MSMALRLREAINAHDLGADGEALDMASVIVAGVRDGRMIWGQLYIGPVEVVDQSIDAAVSKMEGSPSDGR